MVAAIRKEEEGQCPSLCSGPTVAALGSGRGGQVERPGVGKRYLYLAAIPTFRAGMIRVRCQGWGRAVKVEVGEMA